MIFLETRIPGALRIDLERHEDERGSFARSYCRQEFETHGLDSRVEQCNVSRSRFKGTLRGMHYQAAPHAEAKLVRCTRGALHDVIIDLRPDSPAFRRHVALELSEANERMLFVPEGVAHGFLTLEDDTEVFYQMSAAYHPQSARGVRWDDPAFGIHWPFAPAAISDRDRSYPDFGEGA